MGQEFLPDYYITNDTKNANDDKRTNDDNRANWGKKGQLGNKDQLGKRVNWGKRANNDSPLRHQKHWFNFLEFKIGLIYMFLALSGCQDAYEARTTSSKKIF